jgi:hypothetical protein
MHKHHLHHTIISYCTTSHHISFCIDKSSEKTRKIPPSALAKTHESVLIKHDPCFWQKYCHTEFTLSTMVFVCNVYNKNNTVASAKKGDFFLNREKKGMCFLPPAQKWYVRRFHASQRNILHQHTCKLFISVSYKTTSYVQGH